MSKPDGRRLLIHVESRAEQEDLVRFLRTRGCSVGVKSETTVTIDGGDQAAPGLTTLVALVEEWRCAARVAETTLELGDQRTILITEV
jgi:hypothetical protein